jgi:hypothetical protein
MKVKINPKKIVKMKKINLSLFIRRRWWAQVIVIPLVNKIQVFKKGI